MSADEVRAERVLYERPLRPPPERLVEQGGFQYGCYNAAPAIANMLDAEWLYHLRLPRWLRAFRCKQWQAFQLGDGRFFAFSSLYEAKSFGLALFYVWDKEKKKAYEFKRLLPFRSFGIGERLDGQTIGYRERGASLNYSCDLTKGEILVTASVAKRGARPAFSGEFRLAYTARQSAPSSVCLPLGMNRAMYSTKALMPLEGFIILDEERYELNGADAMGIMDDHKGYYPYRMRYDWVTGFGIDARGRRVGFNFTDNQVRDQGQFNENVLWINSRAFPLPPVKITRPNGPAGEWHIQDMEGLVDLLFKPERANDLVIKALVLQSDYHGPFGRFEGKLRSPDGAEKIDAKTLYGMGEQKYLRA